MSTIYERGCKCPEIPCPFHPTPSRPFSNNPTDLQAALRNACDEAAIECHPSNTSSRAVLTGTEVARIFERHLTPVFEALRDSVIEDMEQLHDLEIMLRYAATNRCTVCGWPLAASANEGCIQGNCSYRAHHNPDWVETHSRRAKLLERIMNHNQQPKGAPR